MKQKLFTLYDMYKVRMDDLAERGFPAIAEASKHFSKASDMDHALGFLNCASHWFSGGNNPSLRSEAVAKAWLKNQDKPDAPEPTAPAKTFGNMLLITCPIGMAKKVQKVLELLGCEVVEI